jgi:DNA-binding transcriptional LysR family regulator
VELADLTAFVAIVEKGSLTGAARHLGRSLQSVSRSLAALERDIDAELIQRTTRRSSPTEAGIALHRRLKAGLMEIEIGKAEASNRSNQVSGKLRITGSSAFAPAFVVPAIAAFLQYYPKVEADLDLSDKYVDLAKSGFDLAIRIGGKLDSTLRSKQLAELRSVTFGSPQYLARNGRPTRPEQLSRHQCIVRAGSREENAWRFSVSGKLKTVKVAGRFRTTSAAAANEAAVLGLGIANGPFWQVRPLVDQNFVELVLARFAPPPVAVRAVWTATRKLPVSAELFTDFLAKRLQAERL